MASRASRASSGCGRRRPEVLRQGVPQQRMGSEAGALVLQDHRGGSSRGSSGPPLLPSLPLAPSCPPGDEWVRVEAEPSVRIRRQEAQHVGQVRVDGHLGREEGTRGLHAGSSRGSSSRPLVPGERSDDCLDRRHEGVDTQVARGQGRAAVKGRRVARFTLLASAYGDAMVRRSCAQLRVACNDEALKSAAALNPRAPEMVMKNCQKSAARGPMRNVTLAKIRSDLLEVSKVLGRLDCREETTMQRDPHRAGVEGTHIPTIA